VIVVVAVIVVVVAPVIVAALVIGNANVGVAEEQDRTSLTLHRAPE